MFIDIVQAVDIILTFITASRVRDLNYFTRRLRKRHIYDRDENKLTHKMK